MYIIEKVNKDSEPHKEGGECTVYIESMFLLNFILDFYLLELIGIVLKKKLTYRRLFGSAFLGATGYCIVISLPGISYEIKVMAGVLLVGMIMVKVSCRTKGVRELLYGVGYLFTFSFLLGGFIIFIKEQIPWVRSHSNSIIGLAGMGMVGYMLCKKGINSYRVRKENRFCTVEIQGDGGPVCFTALVDTGNRLKEPFSHKPVAILSEDEWKNISCLRNPEKYKAIPFHSIGKARGILEGYEIDHMEVKEEIGRIQHEKVILAVSKEIVSKEGSYQMILPSELSI